MSEYKAIERYSNGYPTLSNSFLRDGTISEIFQDIYATTTL